MKHNKYWFSRTHLFRLRYAPISWEGWVVSIVDMLVLLACAGFLIYKQPTLSILDIAIVVGVILLDSVTYLVIAQRRSFKWR